MRIFPGVVSAVLTAGVAGAALSAPAAQQTPSFRAATDTVSVYATVLDRGGRLVPDLGKDDFEVYDNGRRQDLTVFSNEVQPITIVIMLDRSGSLLGNFALVRDAAEHFVAHLLPADKARLGSFSQRVQIDPETFTSDRELLVRILRENLQEAGGTPLWNATAAAMDALAREEGRRVVLLFTDGKDNPDGVELNTTLAEVRARLQGEEIMVYAIALASGCAPAPDAVQAAAPPELLFQARGRPPTTGRGGRGVPRRGPAGPGKIPGGRIGGIGGVPPGDGKLGGRPGGGTSGGGSLEDAIKPCSAKPDPELRDLADAGGGGYFELSTTTDLSATFARVADELHQQYLLGFKVAKLDGEAHRLEVRTRVPNVTVRARRSYIAGTGADGPAVKNPRD
jgi:VWFA-related protein